jgi:hypothetical protein
MHIPEVCASSGARCGQAAWRKAAVVGIRRRGRVAQGPVADGWLERRGVHTALTSPVCARLRARPRASGWRGARVTDHLRLFGGMLAHISNNSPRTRLSFSDSVSLAVARSSWASSPLFVASCCSARARS